MVRSPLYLVVLLGFVIATEGLPNVAPPRVPNDADLKAISNELSGKDRSYNGMQVNVPAKPDSTIIIDDLIKGSVDLRGTIDVALTDLYSKFEHSITKEDKPATFSVAKDIFLKEIMKTAVMIRTENFLRTTHGLITKSLEDVLDDIWFGQYSRSLDTSGNKVASSCGFEHVFMAETKFDKAASTQESVIGFHNWIFYYKEQQAKHFDRFQYNENLVLDTTTTNRNMGKLKIYWWKGPITNNDRDPNKLKMKQGSFFFGTSPELEMALYTICFLSRPTKPGITALCPVKLFGKDMNIVTSYITDDMALDGLHATAMNRVGNAHPAT